MAKDIIHKLLQHMEKAALKELIVDLAEQDNATRRIIIEYLKEHVKIPENARQAPEEDIQDIWDGLEPDLSELDEYGGGDYDTEDYVAEQLFELREKLETVDTSREYRRELLKDILKYIRSGNAGMDDPLYDAAYAACKDDDDLRHFAEILEALGRDWPNTNAMRIYRKINDRENYLRLRLKRLKYGMDYHDLVTYYWKNDEKTKALDMLEKGLKNGEGRMDELRRFAAERALDAGDREKFLEIEFAGATEGLTLTTYKKFKELCKEDEWLIYESRILQKTEHCWNHDKLQIYLYRKEYDKALQALMEIRYPAYDENFSENSVLVAAEKLEKIYPKEILRFYKSGMGNMSHAATRKVYAQKAKAAKRVRHVLVDIMKKPKEWQDLKKRIKFANHNRPAFQEEFQKVIPDW